MNPKKLGRRPYFSSELELAIATAYLVDNMSSREVAKKFSPLSPKGKLSESAVRKISKRVGPSLAAA